MDADALMEGYESFRAWFWNKTFWLPENRTWADLKRNNTPGSPFYPDLYDLSAVFPLAIALFFARLLWERYFILLIYFIMKLQKQILSYR